MSATDLADDDDDDDDDDEEEEEEGDEDDDDDVHVFDPMGGRTPFFACFACFFDIIYLVL